MATYTNPFNRPVTFCPSPGRYYEVGPLATITYSEPSAGGGTQVLDLSGGSDTVAADSAMAVTDVAAVSLIETAVVLNLPSLASFSDGQSILIGDVAGLISEGVGSITLTPDGADTFFDSPPALTRPYSFLEVIKTQGYWSVVAHRVGVLSTDVQALLAASNHAAVRQLLDAQRAIQISSLAANQDLASSTTAYQDTSVTVTLAAGQWFIEAEITATSASISSQGAGAQMNFTGTFGPTITNPLFEHEFVYVNLATASFTDASDRRIPRVPCSYTGNARRASTYGVVQKWSGLVTVNASGVFSLQVANHAATSNTIRAWAGAYIKATPVG